MKTGFYLHVINPEEEAADDDGPRSLASSIDSRASASTAALMDVTTPSGEEEEEGGILISNMEGIVATSRLYDTDVFAVEIVEAEQNQDMVQVPRSEQ